MAASSDSSQKVETGLYPKEPIAMTAVILFICWSILIGLFLYFNLVNLRQQVTDLATIEAKENWNKDQAFRNWATRHGGVYVKPDSRTPRNPYLSHLKKRDLVAVDGTKLTLMNPAYMMRQMTEEYEALYGVKGSITGKILLNPINTPDEWQKKVLDEFDNGVKEVIAETKINGDPYLRYMKPMVMKEGCVKCHGHLGFKVGDIRGGVSVSIPLNPFMEAATATSNSIKNSHTFVWFLGCIGIVGFFWSSRNREKERNKLQYEIIQNQHLLEERVIERTKELNVKEKQLLDSQARAHYANKMASLGEMAGGMAHEINSPLQAISLTAFRVKSKVKEMDSNEIIESMTKVDSAVTRISNIIESLRNLSRDSANDPFVNEKVLDIVNDATGITIERFKNNGIEFTINYHDDSKNSSLVCLRLKVAQILVNLLNNAFDAARDSKDCWIKLDVFDTSDSIKFSVTDSGTGVPAEIQDRIFEPMYTSKDIGQGTGVGLSISSDIAKNHGGSLQLDMQSPFTRFVLSLPKNRLTNESDK